MGKKNNPMAKISITSGSFRFPLEKEITMPTIKAIIGMKNIYSAYQLIDD